VIISHTLNPLRLTNYFYLGSVIEAYRFIDAYTNTRLRRWLCNKHASWHAANTIPDEYLYKKPGTHPLPLLLQRFPWAKA
jgi:hypothetical protein